MISPIVSIINGGVIFLSTVIILVSSVRIWKTTKRTNELLTKQMQLLDAQTKRITGTALDGEIKRM